MVGDAGVSSTTSVPLPAITPRITRVWDANGDGQADLLVLATDGVRRSFMDEPLGGEATDELAARILANHGRTSDDALVLVVRYRGPSA